MDNNQFSFHTSFPKLRKWNEVFWPPIFRFLIPQITLISVSKISCENSPLQRTQHPCFSVPSPPGGSWMMGLTLMFHNLPELQTSQIFCHLCNFQLIGSVSEQKCAQLSPMCLDLPKSTPSFLGQCPQCSSDDFQYWQHLPTLHHQQISDSYYCADEVREG